MPLCEHSVRLQRCEYSFASTALRTQLRECKNAARFASVSVSSNHSLLKQTRMVAYCCITGVRVLSFCYFLLCRNVHRYLFWRETRKTIAERPLVAVVCLGCCLLYSTCRKKLSLLQSPSVPSVSSCLLLCRRIVICAAAWP